MKKNLFCSLATLLITFFFLTGQVFAFTVSQKGYATWGNKKVRTMTVAFDSSYPSGGESLTKASLGLSSAEQVIILPQGGHSFVYDYTNQKIKALTGAPPIVYEEKHTADKAGQFTLNHPAAWIINIATLTGNSTWAYSGTTVLATGQVELPDGILDDVRTAVSAYTPSQDYYVTYVTQAWKDIYDLLVQNETITMSTGSTQLESGASIFAFGYVYPITGTSTYLEPRDYKQTVRAGEVGVTMYSCAGGVASGSTVFKFNAAQNGNSAYVTYLKYPGVSSWVVDRSELTGTTSQGAGTYEYFQKPMLMWNVSGGAMAGNSLFQRFGHKYQTAPNQNTFTPYWGFSGLSNWQTQFNAQAQSSGCSLVGTYVHGYPWEIPNLVPLEVTDGTDLSSLTNVKVLIVGF